MASSVIEKKPTMTPREVAEELGADLDSVYAWIKSGELNAWNISCDPSPERKHWRIDRQSVEDFKRRRSGVKIKQNASQQTPQRRIIRRFV